jgi:hypothetical protein
MEPLLIDSCHSTWVFDTDHRRFRRVLKGVDVAHVRPATDWRPYESLELVAGSDAFVVVLNPEGTRLLRSWRHVGDRCENCGEVTAELALDDIDRMVAS